MSDENNDELTRKLYQRSIATGQMKVRGSDPPTPEETARAEERAKEKTENAASLRRLYPLSFANRFMKDEGDGAA